MNETLDLIQKRRSTRNYADTPVTREEKDAILQAAMRSPTAGNMMLYSIIEVEDQALKNRLAVTCDSQPFISKAPYVLLFVADYQRWNDLFELSGAPQACIEKGLTPRTPQEGDLLLACCDTLIAAQTAVIAAESLGIGSCYIGDILENAEQHREMFALPRFTMPVTLVCFGYPAGVREESHTTKRFERKFIVHRDGYQHFQEPELLRLLDTYPAGQFTNLEPDERNKAIARAMYNRKFVSDFSVEMTRSVRQWLKTWTGEV
jgi:FMN reductase (NADPH)/FMN reductase [NAD(P)H]